MINEVEVEANLECANLKENEGKKIMQTDRQKGTSEERNKVEEQMHLNMKKGNKVKPRKKESKLKERNLIIKKEAQQTGLETFFC